ncbi:hypothetical protein SNE40_017238 [Patella caerulea]|uniref:Uncharacterized protein n=1 Tax=Patella caerulea TaxID=87958 RepID=A0AAN8JEL7_PATCE
MNEAHDRIFYTLPEKTSDNKRGRHHQHGDSTGQTKPVTESGKESLIRYICDNIIGNSKVFSGPFGLRKVTYLDYTASGRSLQFIEDYIQKEVLPEYGNTHTTTSVTSLQTTLYRHEARDIIRNTCNAGEHDSVIFVGSGCTAAVNKLLHALNLKQPPVVFVGPYEHHSLFLPWLQKGAEVIRIRQTTSGLIDVDHLQTMLKKYENCGQELIGCFSAASNITGILVDVNNITITLHRYGALALWDYATAAPYVQIDMNPVIPGEDQHLVYKDAVFISPHKFVGGVSTPGLLLVKKKLFRNAYPEVCGGGSVFYVRRDGQRYLQEPELKEEGGTPSIVESIRAGLVFQLKQAVTAQVIMDREHSLLQKALAVWNKCPNLVILGNTTVSRLPVFPFLIYHPGNGRFLHHNFVSAILNDVFGIQSRGGCACAGPYAMDLLGLNEEMAEKIENLLVEDGRLDRTHLRRYREYSHREILRPGFTRLNLPFFMTEEELNFVVESVAMVAEHGWKLLPQYIFNPETGEWRQKNFQTFKDRKWLGHISYDSDKMEYKLPPPVVKGPLPDTYQDCLSTAEQIFEKTAKTRITLSDQPLLFDEESKKYRWFFLPSEAQDCLQGNKDNSVSIDQLPFCPKVLKERLGLVDSIEDTTNHISVNFWTPLKRENLGKESQVPFSDGMVKCLNRGFTSEESPNNAHKLAEDNQEKNYNSWTSILENRIVDKSDNSGLEGKDLVNNKSMTVISDNTVVGKHPDVSTEPNNLVLDKQDPVHLIKLENESRTDVNSAEDTGSEIRLESEQDGSRDCEDRAASDLVNSKNIEHVYPDTGNYSDNVNPDTGNYSDSVNLVCPLLKKPVSNSALNEYRNKKVKWFSPPKDIFKPTVMALEEYNMIQDGDRLLVCLSGGKDSLSLLHTIRQYQFYCRAKGVNFEFGAVTVDPQTPAYDPSPLIDYLASLGVPYFFESQGILETASNLPYECASICSFCSRMKRGRIYACARRERYNVLALGQHLDDLSESFLMSYFHNGSLRTMKASYTIREGDLRVIRPFVYVREKLLRTFAEKSKLPVIAENCPACFEAPKERHRTKQLLASQELLFPQLYSSMMAAMKPIMAINKTGTNINSLLNGPSTTEDEDDS